jgi:hypothetical protein
MFILWILLSIVIAVAVWLGFWWLVNLLVNRGKRHQQFINGNAPNVAPDGFYQGTAHILFDQKVPWLGKSFDSPNNLGFNIFTPFGAKLLKILAPFYQKFRTDEAGNTEAFNFKTVMGAGLKDTNVSVIKLDYDAPENPFPIRIILDEIVEIAPEQFLGKIHLKVFPGFYATIGYFGLKKN